MRKLKQLVVPIRLRLGWNQLFLDAWFLKHSRVIDSAMKKHDSVLAKPSILLSACDFSLQFLRMQNDSLPAPTTPRHNERLPPQTKTTE
jgi:hypothetical protein